MKKTVSVILIFITIAGFISFGYSFFLELSSGKEIMKTERTSITEATTFTETLHLTPEGNPYIVLLHSSFDLDLGRNCDIYTYEQTLTDSSGEVIMTGTGHSYGDGGRTLNQVSLAENFSVEYDDNYTLELKLDRGDCNERINSLEMGYSVKQNIKTLPLWVSMVSLFVAVSSIFGLYFVNRKK